ncbi:hypothetical protein A2U01_0021613, partial [Trifolium medium]|nr:hypothetical protein [Trifolium medium]
QNATQVHLEIERNGDTQTPRDTRTPFGYGIMVLVFIPVENCDGFKETELYEFRFGEDKIRPRPIAMPR